MRRVLGAIATAVAIAGCGTVKTVVVTRTTAAAPVVYVDEQGGQTNLVEPSEFAISDPGKYGNGPTFQFSGLSWKRWGSPTATGRGEVIRLVPGEADKALGPGRIVVNQIVGCHGRLYYSIVTSYIGSRSLGGALNAPCNHGLG